MSTPSFGHPLTDGVVTLRASRPEDNEVIVNGRDAVFRRFMGEGHPEPDPVACITVAATETATETSTGETIVGWIDYDSPRPWLTSGEVNVGYSIFPEHRGNGYATRGLELLVKHLTADASVISATLLIDAANDGSIGVAHRASFVRHDDVDGERFYKRSTVTPDSNPASDPGQDRDRRPAD